MSSLARYTSGRRAGLLRAKLNCGWKHTGEPPPPRLPYPLPPSLSLLLIISVSLSLAVFLYPTLFQHVSKKSAREYKSTIRHSRKLSGVLFPSDQSSGHCVLFALWTKSYINSLLVLQTPHGVVRPHKGPPLVLTMSDKGEQGRLSVAARPLKWASAVADRKLSGKVSAKRNHKRWAEWEMEVQV